jgi:hypothetical protein
MQDILNWLGQTLLWLLMLSMLGLMVWGAIMRALSPWRRRYRRRR